MHEVWRKAIILEDLKISDAIQNLDSSNLKICLVVSSDGILVGTISDGDIRRSLLRGLSIDDQITKIINKNPITVPRNTSPQSAARVMSEFQIFQLPVVDINGRIAGLHVYGKTLEADRHENTIVIMAGKGTRLLPYTKNTPKPMILIQDKPILQVILEKAKAEGFYNFVFSIHHLGEVIEQYFGDGKNFGVSITYLRENSPLGTAGSLSLLQGEFSHPIIVSNGDVISKISFSEALSFHSQHNSDATMAVKMHELQNPFGVVDLDGISIVGFEEKPVFRSYINAGVYVLSPDSLKLLNPDEYCDMPSLFLRLKASGKNIVAFPIYEEWLDIGRPDDLKKALSNS